MFKVFASTYWKCVWKNKSLILKYILSKIPDLLLFIIVSVLLLTNFYCFIENFLFSVSYKISFYLSDIFDIIILILSFPFHIN